MMQRRWLGLAAIFLTVAGVSAAGGARFARSQAAFPEGAFVVGSDDTRWVVGGGARYRLSFVTDDAGLLPGLRDGGVVSTIAEAQAALAGRAAPVSAPPASNPAASLVGQQVRTCNYGVEFTVSVARAEWLKTVVGAEAPGNGMWVVAILDVTNESAKDEGLFSESLAVKDARGREFEWKNYPPDPVELFRAYNVKLQATKLIPGVTDQNVATFLVPNDAGPLTLIDKRPLC